MLKTGEVQFCAFLSCVVVSSFIETRQHVFFPEVITDSEADECDKLTVCATVFLVGFDNGHKKTIKAP